MLKGMESDDEIRRVPEMGAEPAGASASRRDSGTSAVGPDRVEAQGQVQRKRGRSPADKESKRLKRYEAFGLIGISVKVYLTIK